MRFLKKSLFQCFANIFGRVMTKSQLFAKVRRLQLEAIRDVELEPEDDVLKGRLEGINRVIEIIVVYLKEG